MFSCSFRSCWDARVRVAAGGEEVGSGEGAGSGAVAKEKKAEEKKIIKIQSVFPGYLDRSVEVKINLPDGSTLNNFPKRFIPKTTIGEIKKKIAEEKGVEAYQLFLCTGGSAEPLKDGVLLSSLIKEPKTPDLFCLINPSMEYNQENFREKYSDLFVRVKNECPRIDDNDEDFDNNNSCRVVKYLLDNNEIGALKDYFNCIDKLDLSDENIGPAEAKVIANALERNYTIRELNLRDNRIGDGGAVAIANALEANATLWKLNLRGNRIGDVGAGALAKMLKENKTITSLNLEDNSIEDAGALAEVAIANPNLDLLLNNQDLSITEFLSII